MSEKKPFIQLTSWEVDCALDSYKKMSATFVDVKRTCMLTLLEDLSILLAERESKPIHIEGCFYCNEEHQGHDWHNGIGYNDRGNPVRRGMSKGWNYALDDYNYTEEEVKYCPKCGRYLSQKGEN